MPLYEHVCIARQELSQSQVDNLLSKLGSILQDNGGRIAGSEYWGARRLAYRIKKYRRGHYLFLKLDSPPSAIQELERLMRINEDVIRFLTIKVDKFSEDPSPIMQSRDKRFERGRR